jgi:2-polyprenyl-6-methoxyphenol hydroxylase-like FAD-dependent oxidoreductase
VTGVDVLVSGASIAGPTVAYWLVRAGHRVTVVERSPELRTGGQNIDVRGPGREVLRRMGLEDAVLAESTGEVGLRFVDEHRVLAEFAAGTDDSGGATAQAEILRGTLSRLLVDACGGDVNYVFGDQIERLEPGHDAVTAVLASGATLRADVVIVTEGVRSRTRDSYFTGVELRDVGLYTAFGALERTATDDRWWNWYNTTGGRAITLRPDNVGSTRFTVSFLSGDPRLLGLDAAGQRAALSAAIGDAGWQAPRICAALADEGEVYLDYLAQVRMPAWSRGRVVLCGDAAWCATPLSGMGTTLALTGGYVLAREILRAPALAEALDSYELLMRPLVDRAQKLPPGVPRLAHPRSRAGVAVTRKLIGFAGSGPARRLARRLSMPDTDADQLPA